MGHPHLLEPVSYVTHQLLLVECPKSSFLDRSRIHESYDCQSERLFQYFRHSTEYYVIINDDSLWSVSRHTFADPKSPSHGRSTTPRFLDVHRAIALVMKLSGADEHIERVLRDMEELDFR